MSFLLGFGGGIVVGVAITVVFLIWHAHKNNLISITKPK